jgi:hypothetical protein
VLAVQEKETIVSRESARTQKASCAESVLKSADFGGDWLFLFLRKGERREH